MALPNQIIHLLTIHNTILQLIPCLAFVELEQRLGQVGPGNGLGEVDIAEDSLAEVDILVEVDILEVDTGLAGTAGWDIGPVDSLVVAQHFEEDKTSQIKTCSLHNLTFGPFLRGSL